ncbi:MAG: sugar kinase [Parahaliea sp.]
MTKPRAAAIGECMLELSAACAESHSKTLRLGFGGDTLNTAIYLTRLGVQADYITLLGDDSHSDWMLSSWAQEGVGTACVVRLAGRMPGLYLIETDPDGERHFSYWRGESPARELFDCAERVAVLEQALAQCQLVYYSGITLSLYPEASRERLFDMLGRLRSRGVKVGFDGNYRPRGWPERELARSAFRRACQQADVVLPTWEDEQALFGDRSPEQTLGRVADWGAGEIVLKLGGAGCRIWRDGRVVDVPTRRVERPLDTTSAGDSFNAGYLAGRLYGEDPQRAAARGHRLAAQVIQVRGAIIPREAMPEGIGDYGAARSS